mmetsp:Transcript_7106/g.9869  ORF Transcript_7106/g.9869 Transcript_7106/m.9869 type:complete len:296 (+) Transcript_7106:319-1206(+)
MPHDGLCDIQGKEAAGTNPRVHRLLIGGAKSTVPCKGLVQLLAGGIEDIWVLEDLGVSVCHGDNVLIECLRWHRVWDALEQEFPLVGVNASGTCHRRVDAARLLDVLHRTGFVCLQHVFSRGILLEANQVGARFFRDLSLKESADCLAAGTRATDPSKAHSKHDLIAKLHVRRPSVFLRKVLVHLHKHWLKPMLFNDPDRVHPKLLYPANGEIEDEPVNQPWEDKEHSIVSPLAEDQCIVVVEPNTEDHEEDALDDHQAQLLRVIEVREFWLWPLGSNLRAQLLQALRVMVSTSV